MTKGGFTLWLTGLSGAGKTTLARAAESALATRGLRVEVLDGDEIRAAMNSPLGFTKTDRDIHVRYIGLMARRLSRNGVAVVVAAISPYRAVRDEIRGSHESPFIEVFVDCPLEELQRRDGKGLYARALAGALDDFTGISAPYEPPAAPDLHLRTDQQSVSECLAQTLAHLDARGLLRRQD